MARLKELLEIKGQLAAEIRKQTDKINAENRDFTEEEKAGWDKLNADYDANQAKLERENRASQVEASLKESEERRPAPAISTVAGRGEVTEEDRAEAVAGWFTSTIGDNEPTERQAEAMRKCGVRTGGGLTLGNGTTSQFNQTRQEFLATDPKLRKNLYRGPGATSLVTGTTSAAGYLIPPGILQRSLEINMLAFGGMRQMAQVIKTSDGEPFYWPTADDTGNTGALLAEVTTIGSSTNPTIGRVSWSAFKFSSKLIRYSAEMEQDSAFSLSEVLGEMLGERLGRITNTKYTVGAGTTEPSGIVTDASSAFTAGSASAVTADELIDLFHSVDPAYRPNATFMANDTVIKALRKLKDSQGHYLWSAGGVDQGIAGGFSDNLLGRTMTTNQDMAAMTTGLKPILFGDISRYKIRSVSEIRLRKLVELYADTDETGMVAFIREDGRLLKAGTAVAKYITMA